MTKLNFKGSPHITDFNFGNIPPTATPFQVRKGGHTGEDCAALARLAETADDFNTGRGSQYGQQVQGWLHRMRCRGGTFRWSRSFGQATPPATLKQLPDGRQTHREHRPSTYSSLATELTRSDSGQNRGATSGHGCNSGGSTIGSVAGGSVVQSHHSSIGWLLSDERKRWRGRSTDTNKINEWKYCVCCSAQWSEVPDTGTSLNSSRSTAAVQHTIAHADPHSEQATNSGQFCITGHQ